MSLLITQTKHAMRRCSTCMHAAVHLFFRVLAERQTAMLAGQKRNPRLFLAVAPAYVWLAAITALPHKEERFLYVTYPVASPTHAALLLAHKPAPSLCPGQQHPVCIAACACCHMHADCVATRRLLICMAACNCSAGLKCWCNGCRCASSLLEFWQRRQGCWSGAPPRSCRGEHRTCWPSWVFAWRWACFSYCQLRELRQYWAITVHQCISTGTYPRHACQPAI